jgi:uncharacterized Zn-finger protein
MTISEHFPLDLSHIVALTAQYLGDRYERDQVHLCLHRDDFSDVSYITIKDGQITLPFRHTDMAVGGLRKPFLCKRYGWFIRPFDGTGDGVLKATYDVVGQELEGTFKFALTNEADGIWRGRILPIDTAGNVIAGPECYVPFRFWIDGNHTAKDVPLHIAQTDSFEWTHENDAYSLNLPSVYHAAVLPKRTAFLPHPLPVNVAPFPTLPSGTPKAQLSRINLGPAMDEGNRFYPTRTDRGITVTENAQGYYFSQGPIDFLSPLPFLPLMDGPRNVATYGFTTDVWQGRDRKFYHSTPYSRRVVDSRGEVRTLFGLYSKYPAYWGDLVRAAAKGVLHPSLGIRGNWPGSTRPRERQFALRSWFEFFLPWTVTQGTGTPVKDATMVVAESPHPAGVNPTSVVGDDHGWILEVVYDGNDHTKEPDIYERYKVDRLFGGKLHTDNLLYVVERAKHRVLAIDPKTWTLVRVVIDGGAAAAALGSINAQDDTFYLAAGKTMADARAVGCVDISGLDIAGDWMYVGSMAMGGVFRVNLLDGTQQWCRTILTGFQSHFINVRVMADHTLFTCTFDNQYFGHPRAWLPVADATQTHSQAWDWAYFGYDQAQGVGSTGTLVDIYPMSMSVTKDAIAVGGSQEGLAVFVKRDPSETIPDATKMRAGHREYNGAALYLQYGRFGMGAEPAPAGLTLNSDYWLTANGITPGEQPVPTPTPTPTPVPTPTPTPVPPPTPTPTPPPTGNTMAFKSVAFRVATADGSDLPAGVNPTDQYSPPTTAIPHWQIMFHGSGGPGGPLAPTYRTGDKFRAQCDKANSLTHLDSIDVPFIFHAANVGGRVGVSTAPPIFELQPVDALVLQAPYAGRLATRTWIETWHTGYCYNSTPVANTSRASGGTFEPFSLRKYDAMLADAKVRYPQVDWSTKGTTYGHSMGGTACFMYALTRYDKFGGFYAVVPRVKLPNTPDYNAGADTLNTSALLPDGTNFLASCDMVKWLLDNPTKKTPFASMVAVNRDGFETLQNYIDCVAALRQTKRPFAVILLNGTHSGAYGDGLMNTRIKATYTPDMFDGKKGMLVISDSSRDEDLSAAFTWPNADPSSIPYTAGVNIGFQWAVQTETASQFVVKVRTLLLDAATGAYLDKVPYAAGVTQVNIAMPYGLGCIIPGDSVFFQGDPTTYTATNTVADVAKGGVLTFTPALKTALPAGYGGSSISVIVKAGPNARPGTVTGNALPYSDVFTAAVPAKPFTCTAGAWTTLSFDAADAQLPPPPTGTNPAGVITSFTGDKATITRGQTVTLSWVTSNMTRLLLVANQGAPVQVGAATDGNADAGSVVVTPDVDTTYTLLADDRNADVTVKTVTVGVTQPAADPQLRADLDALKARVDKMEAWARGVEFVG